MANGPRPNRTIAILVRQHEFPMVVLSPFCPALVSALYRPCLTQPRDTSIIDNKGLTATRQLLSREIFEKLFRIDLESRNLLTLLDLRDRSKCAVERHGLLRFTEGERLDLQFKKAFSKSQNG